MGVDKNKNSSDTTDLLKNSLKNGLKTYHQYDGQARVEAVWEAPVSASIGQPALLTILEYVGVTQQIQSTREAVSEWTATMEAALPVDPALP